MNDEKNRSGHSERYPCAHHGANADAKIGRLPSCDFRVPDATAEWCKTHRPDVLLMEVKAYSPWMFEERMEIRDKVKRNTENCRVILFVDDDTDGELTEKVRQAKREGLIDAFLFGSVSENYFASVIDSV